MHPAFCVVLWLLVLQTSAFDAQNALDFAEGFAFGITNTITRNTTACVEDFVSLVENFDTGFHELGKGLQLKKTSDMVLGITDLGHGIEKTGNMLVECGVISTALRVGEIGYDINEGKYISIVVTEAAAELLHKNHPITTNIKKSIDYWEKKDYYESGKALGNVIGLILTDTDPTTYAFLYQKGYDVVTKMFALTPGAWDWTKDTAGKVGEGATDVAGKVAEGATDVAGKVAEGGQTMWDWTKGTANDVAEGAQEDAAGKVAEKVGGWFHF